VVVSDFDFVLTKKNKNDQKIAEDVKVKRVPSTMHQTTYKTHTQREEEAHMNEHCTDIRY
jgi:hypothetical protein